MTKRWVERARQVAATSESSSGYLFCAILWRGQTPVRIVTNSDKTRPANVRRWPNGAIQFTSHAEMNVLCAAQPGDTVSVLRFARNGTLRISKPCETCERLLRQAGIRKVEYVNNDGQLVAERY